MASRTKVIIITVVFVAAAVAGAETLSITVPDAWLKAQTKDTTIPLNVTGTASG